jgi:hypothetical protein
MVKKAAAAEANVEGNSIGSAVCAIAMATWLSA